MFGDRRISEALKTGQVGIWRWEVASGRLDWSPNLEAIHGLPPGSFSGGFESFASDIHPADRGRVMQAIQAALRDGGAYQVQYRLPPRPGGADAGNPGGEHWIQARGAAELADGVAVAMTGICQDITAQKRAELELATRLRQQEAVAALGEEALQAAELQPLFDRATGLLAEVLEVDLAKVLELTPQGDSLLLRAGHGFAAGLVGTARVGAGLDSQAGFTLASDRPVVSPELARESRFSGPPLLHELGIVSGMSTVIRGTGGHGGDRPFGVLGVHARRPRAFAGHDIAFLQSVANILAGAVQKQAAEAQRELLFRDQRHRTANLFSQLMSIHRQTARSAASVGELTEKFQNRMMAAAQAHEVISKGGPNAPTPLRLLLEGLLRPYGPRASLDGPPVLLPADHAFSLSLALNELATNAAKYGGLSGAGAGGEGAGEGPAAEEQGSLSVRWTLQGLPGTAAGPGQAGTAQRLDLAWRERSPAPLAPPARSGFGTRLVDTIVERQLHGEVQRDYAADGLQLRLAFDIAAPG